MLIAESYHAWWSILSRLWEIAKNNKKYAIFDFFLYGRWEDLDRWKWVVIDVGVILDAFASHSENFFFPTFFELVRIAKANWSQKLEV